MDFSHMQKVEISQNGDTLKLHVTFSLSCFFTSCPGRKINFGNFPKEIYVHPPESLIQFLNFLAPFASDYYTSCNDVRDVWRYRAQHKKPGRNFNCFQ